jgi:hypothetical protein
MNNFLILAGVLVGGYVLYKVASTPAAKPTSDVSAVANAGGKVADALKSIFGSSSSSSSSSGSTSSGGWVLPDATDTNDAAPQPT